MSAMTAMLLSALAVWLTGSGTPVFRRLKLTRAAGIVIAALWLAAGLLPPLRINEVYIGLQGFVLPLFLGVGYASWCSLWRQPQAVRLFLAVIAVRIGLDLLLPAADGPYGAPECLIMVLLAVLLADRPQVRFGTLLLGLPLGDMGIEVLRLLCDQQADIRLGGTHASALVVASLLGLMLWLGAEAFLTGVKCKKGPI